MSEENWKPIPGYEGRYDVSDQGRVRSWVARNGMEKPRILVTYQPAGGYPMFGATGGTGRPSRTTSVHAAVMAAFVGPRPPGYEVLHSNGIASDNRLVNLRYGTSSENKLDIVRHGRSHQAVKTHCPRGHAYDEANTRYQPNGGRKCRTCHREWERARYRRSHQHGAVSG